MKLISTPLALAISLALSGCAIGPDYLRPSSLLPSVFSKASPEPVSLPESTIVDTAWWQRFGDSTLNSLVEQSLEQNANVRTAVARLEQAEAAAREAGAAFLPEIDGQASGSNNKLSTKTATWSANSPKIVHSRGASLTTSYELDVWGRVRRSNEAARASLLASRYSRDSIRLTVAGQVSSNYLALRAADAEIAITTASLESRQESLKLVKTRVDAGLVSPLDQYQAEGALSAMQAQIADLRRQRALFAHQLALLSGNPELEIPAGDLRQLPMPPIPPEGLPSALVEGRPDVRQAEENLIAANAGIGIAKAGYFPRFSLTGSLGSESKSLSDLFGAGAGTWSLGLGLLMPVIDFGRTSARVDQAAAINKQSLISYQNTLQTAFKEVRDALVSLRENADSDNAQTRRVESTGKALDLAQRRYAAGYSGYLEVLDAQRSNNDAQLAMIATRQARLASAVDLFKAIGGGWKDDAANSR
ncbi:efflux transporter outer membrane subunit [Dechloromonas sp. TW-R-39-2]|uniref:efflux transporter outer membrane subunit n=1 Tax=Dechloromonas sp. TW-R-39-2 TaxID=2654218 RepID=UPI00193CB964|nr:efflux transporter outer membrane subunit [Dechloromonas sp. TW-R-39-2]QRM19221.1 efflux transporter outer membrane subunit [Dechloromonas sp. TW-R-39-2]